MPNATVTVKYVNPVKPGGKKGSIKDASGQMYLVWPDKLAMFQPNNTYEVEYASDYGNDGKEWRTIKTVMPTGINPPAPQQQQYRPAYGGGRSSGPQQARPTAPQDARRMWTCSLVNAAISAGQVNVLNEELLAQAAVNCLRVWEQVWGNEGETEH